MKLIFFVFVMLICSLIIAEAIYRQQNKYEDFYYGRMLKKYPDKYAICAKCGRPRPHKKMIYYKAWGGWCCDEHFGIK